MTNHNSFGLLEINWDRLHQISDADTEFELELLNMLAIDMEEQLVSLQTAIDQQDIKLRSVKSLTMQRSCWWL
jgi:hypothetical protein